MPHEPELISATRAVAARIGEAARAWLSLLDPAQRSRATFSFDDEERFVWEYTPGPRRGLSLGEMSADQCAAAFAVVGAALSDRGAADVRAVIALEPILGALERDAGRGNWIRRNPDLYWFALFGEPDRATPWSWRIGGHHVAISQTMLAGDVLASTPSFLGANPATVPGGPPAGARALDGEERLARELLASLSVAQRTLAIVEPTAPPDILSGNSRRVRLSEIPSGIRHDQLDDTQRAALEGLIRHYLGRAQPALADAAWDQVRTAGLDAVTFAWAGPDEPGRGHYYAIRGPRLLIEYDNTQNGANHIHAVWRDPLNDWGEDLLAAHYREAHLPR